MRGEGGGVRQSLDVAVALLVPTGARRGATGTLHRAAAAGGRRRRDVRPAARTAVCSQVTGAAGEGVTSDVRPAARTAVCSQVTGAVGG